MCAIAGFLQTGNAGLADAEGVIASMIQVQRHRGPDGSGVWLDRRRRVALGHRRLKVVDLSPEGDQPMVSRSGRFCVTFNGEIYNHLQIRAELEGLEPGRAWRGHSDTETLLAAVERWGIAGAIERCIGMFAIGVWDEAEHTLTLARDRIGEKPLYYGHARGTFLFASELKAFSAFPGFDAAIDDDALALFFWFNYIPAPHSIFRNARKLAPGTLLTIDEAGTETEQVYWSLETALRAPRFAGSAGDAAERAEALLRDAVRLQSVADVPVGAFLSGGIDSSTIVALMSETGARVKTFSLGFEDQTCNEAPYARAIAAHLGTDHQEMIVSAADARDLIPRLPEIWDEPFGDSSQIPTALVSRMARERVTVSLTGDGGDELFCGYPSYRSASRIEKIPAKRALAVMLDTPSPEHMARAYNRLPFAPRRPMTSARIASLVHRLTLADAGQRFLSSAADWRGEKSLLSHAALTPLAQAKFPQPEGVDLPTYFSAIDTRTYLVDDLLVKVDRAGMASSLETRMPMLDHRLVEFAFRVPESIKLRGGQSKWALRQMLGNHVPAKLFDRPKQGFSIPVASWLRHDLRDWAGDLLSPSSLASSGFLDATRVTRLWDDHRTGRADHSGRLWGALMFLAWENAR